MLQNVKFRGSYIWWNLNYRSIDNFLFWKMMTSHENQELLRVEYFFLEKCGSHVLSEHSPWNWKFFFLLRHVYTHRFNDDLVLPSQKTWFFASNSVYQWSRSQTSRTREHLQIVIFAIFFLMWKPCCFRMRPYFQTYSKIRDRKLIMLLTGRLT